MYSINRIHLHKKLQLNVCKLFSTFRVGDFEYPFRRLSSVPVFFSVETSFGCYAQKPRRPLSAPRFVGATDRGAMAPTVAVKLLEAVKKGTEPAGAWDEGSGPVRWHEATDGPVEKLFGLGGFG